MAAHGAVMHIMGGMCTCRRSQLFDTAAGRFAIYVTPLSPARIAYRPLAKSFLSILRFYFLHACVSDFLCLHREDSNGNDSKTDEDDRNCESNNKIIT